MQEPSIFFLQQAEQCGRAADAAALPHQRETFLRSQAAWQALADRKLATIAGRTRIEAEKAIKA